MKRAAGKPKVCHVHGKHCYRSQSHAIRAALNCSRKRATSLRVYYDRTCGSFHLTSKALRWWEEVA